MLGLSLTTSSGLRKSSWREAESSSTANGLKVEVAVRAFVQTQNQSLEWEPVGNTSLLRWGSPSRFYLSKPWLSQDVRVSLPHCAFGESGGNYAGCKRSSPTFAFCGLGKPWYLCMLIF